MQVILCLIRPTLYIYLESTAQIIIFYLEGNYDVHSWSTVFYYRPINTLSTNVKLIKLYSVRNLSEDHLTACVI